jgi:hypothetical protein
MAGTTGLEPATSAVTGQRSNQLNYVPRVSPKTCTTCEPCKALKACNTVRWWAVTDLNRGPSRCKRDALTADPRSRLRKFFSRLHHRKIREQTAANHGAKLAQNISNFSATINSAPPPLTRSQQYTCPLVQEQKLACPLVQVSSRPIGC